MIGRPHEAPRGEIREKKCAGAEVEKTVRTLYMTGTTLHTDRIAETLVIKGRLSWRNLGAKKRVLEFLNCRSLIGCCWLPVYKQRNSTSDYRLWPFPAYSKFNFFLIKRHSANHTTQILKLNVYYDSITKIKNIARVKLSQQNPLKKYEIPKLKKDAIK